jgi:hypothetical protein
MHRSFGPRRGRRYLLAAVAVVAATALVSGCGGGKNEIVVPKTKDSLKKRGNDPCKLLREGDVTTTYGTPFAAGVPSAGVDEQCEFRADNSDPTAPVVSLHVKGEVTVAGFETARLTALPDARDVIGVGDQAYYRSQEGRLYVREGVFEFDLGVTPHPEPGSMDRLMLLAQLVVKRHK